MSLRIKEGDSKLSIPRLDGGGVPIFNYEGKPFTGIVFENENDGSLSWEEEYIDGFQEGWYRSFHKNGKIKQQWKAHNNIIISGTHKEWDENGNLIWESKS